MKQQKTIIVPIEYDFKKENKRGWYAENIIETTIIVSTNKYDDNGNYGNTSEKGLIVLLYRELPEQLELPKTKYDIGHTFMYKDKLGHVFPVKIISNTPIIDENDELKYEMQNKTFITKSKYNIGSTGKYDVVDASLIGYDYKDVIVLYDKDIDIKIQ